MITLPTSVNRHPVSAFGGRGVVVRRADAQTVTRIEPVAPGSRAGRRQNPPHRFHREPTGDRPLLAGLKTGLIDPCTTAFDSGLTGLPRHRLHARASAAYRAADALSLHYFHAAFPFDLKA